MKEGRLRKVMVTLGDRSMTVQTGIGVVGQNVMAGREEKVLEVAPRFRPQDKRERDG